MKTNHYKITRVWMNGVEEFHVMPAGAQYGDGAFAVCTHEVNAIIIVDCLNRLQRGE